MPDSSFHQWLDVDRCSPSPDFALSFSDCVLDGVQMRTRVSLNLIAVGWEIKFTKSTQECVTFKGNGRPLTQPLQNMCVSLGLVDLLSLSFMWCTDVTSACHLSLSHLLKCTLGQLQGRQLMPRSHLLVEGQWLLRRCLPPAALIGVLSPTLFPSSVPEPVSCLLCLILHGFLQAGLYHPSSEGKLDCRFPHRGPAALFYWVDGRGSTSLSAFTARSEFLGCLSLCIARTPSFQAQWWGLSWLLWTTTQLFLKSGLSCHPCLLPIISWSDEWGIWLRGI